MLTATYAIIHHSIHSISFSSVSNARPGFTAKPNKPLIGFQGEAVNFTWVCSNHSISKIYFGVYNNDWGTLENTLIWVTKHKNGTIIVTSAQKSQDTAPYVDRLRWFGDLSQNKVTFELSGLSSADRKYYGIEVCIY